MIGVRWGIGVAMTEKSIDRFSSIKEQKKKQKQTKKNHEETDGRAIFPCHRRRRCCCPREGDATHCFHY